MNAEVTNIFHEESFNGVGGLKIATRSWLPVTAPRAVVLLLHGFNSHSGQYGWVGEQLAEHGYAVYALDHRGRGKSDGRRFYVEKFADYLADVDTLAKLARSRHPGLPVFVFGHSAGGVIASSYAFEHQKELAGLISESFAFRVPAPGFLLSALKAFSLIAPKLGVLALDNNGFSRDPEAVKALKNDPLIANEKQPAHTVAEMLRANERLETNFPKFTLPVLIMHGTADSVTVPAGSQMFFDKAGSRDKTLKLYEGHFHDLFADYGKEAVVDDLKSWIDARIKPA